MSQALTQILNADRRSLCFSGLSHLGNIFKSLSNTLRQAPTAPVFDVVAFANMDQLKSEDDQSTKYNNVPGAGSRCPKRKRTEDQPAEGLVFRLKKQKYGHDVSPGHGNIMSNPSDWKNFEGPTINTNPRKSTSEKRKHGSVFVEDLPSLMKRCKIGVNRPDSSPRTKQKGSWASIDAQGWDYKTGALQGRWNLKACLVDDQW